MPTSDHTLAVPAFVAAPPADPGLPSDADRRIPTEPAARPPAPPARSAAPTAAGAGRPTPAPLVPEGPRR